MNTLGNNSIPMNLYFALQLNVNEFINIVSLLD